MTKQTTIRIRIRNRIPEGTNFNKFMFDVQQGEYPESTEDPKLNELCNRSGIFINYQTLGSLSETLQKIQELGYTISFKVSIQRHNWVDIKSANCLTHIAGLFELLNKYDKNNVFELHE